MGTRISLNVDIEGKNATSALNKLRKAVQGLDKQRSVAQKGFTGFGTVLGGVLGANLITAGISRITSGLGNLSRSVFDTAADLETINQRFEILTGSVAGANKIVQELTDFTATTPFRLEGVTNAAAQLISFGFEANEVTDRLREIGDVAAGSGSNLNEVALIFGQVAAAGKLTGERLLQFQERAIPIGPAIAKTLGIAESAVKDLVSAGKVDLDTFQKAFASLSGEQGIFFEATIKQSKTLTGILSTLGDNFTLVAGEIGTKFLPVFKEAALALINFVQENRKLIISLAVEPVVAFGEAIQTAFGFFKDNIEVLTTVSKLLLNIVSIYGLYRVGVLATAAAQTAWNAAMGVSIISLKALKVALISTGIGALVVGLGLAAAAFLKAKDLNISFTDALKDTAGSVIEFFLPAIGAVASGIGSLVGIFNKDLAESVKNSVSSLEALAVSLKKPAEESRKSAQIVKESMEEEARVVREANERRLQERDEQQSVELSKEEEEFEARLARVREKIAKEKEQEREELLLQQELQKELLDRLRLEDEAEDKKRQEILKALRTKTATEDQKELAKELALIQKVRDEAEKKKRDQELAAQKQFIADREKFGTAIATIDQILATERVQSAKTVAGELVALQRSSNSTLKALGKAAAVAQITISTAESAAVIAAKVIQALPFPVNVPIAAALAAGRVAFGAEQIGNVLKAQTGGFVPLAGGTPGQDSVPASLTPGEFITPARSADETIEAVIRQRGFVPKEEVNDLLDSREESSIVVNIAGNVIADDETQLNTLIESIRDQIEFRNATLDPIG